MKIGILGTRGIPNNYGGFEQFAAYISVELLSRGHEVYVYNSDKHPYKNDSWNNVRLIHCYDPEKLGTFGQFIYDLNCIIDSRKRKFDILLQLGYTSSSVWGPILPKRSFVVTNMDGMEWKRSKYGKQTQKFLQFAERLAVMYSDHLVADSIGIKEYLENKYKTTASLISYSAETFDHPEEDKLKRFYLRPYQYDLLIARLEPENSIETILRGYVKSEMKRKFIVVGNTNTAYGTYIKNKFYQKGIVYAGSIYDKNLLDNLRFYSNLYFHGHTVGGTNPSLLEAMGSMALICAHLNIFNRSVTGNDAYYFSNPGEITELIDHLSKTGIEIKKLENNYRKIATDHTIKRIADEYEVLFERLLEREPVSQEIMLS